jgi:hypothetical protein
MNNSFTSLKSNRQINLLIAAVFVALQLVLALSLTRSVSADQAETEKVTICHGTDAVKNPYVRLTVDADSADGNTDNDNGKGDHSEHTGPIATSEAVAQALKDNKQAWGDIIPAHHNYAGLNWTAEGQAIYNNNCNYATTDEPTTPDDEGDVLGTTTTNQATPARGGVGAGFGGGDSSIVVSAFGLVTSLGLLSYGAANLLRRNS